MTDIHTDTQNASAPEATEQSLDDFSATFFAADKPATEPTPEETDTDTDEGVTSQEDDIDEPEVDDGEDGEEPEAPEEPKGKKKSRFQERIDDLTHKLREGERNREALEQRLAEAIAKLETSAAPAASDDAPKPKAQNTPTEGGLVEPTADDLNEDGSPKYPLGEFDPKLLRDLTRYDRAVERAHEAKVAAEAKAEAERMAQFNTMQAEWDNKVTAAKETYPDYVEKGQKLLDSLGDVPADYAAYLSQNIMSMEYGPDVFYYLAEHPEEAKAIVNSSPEKALNRLGRIEARFEIAADERSGKETKLRVTKAPEPPVARTRGSNAHVEDDPNDLDAFARKFFKK